MSSTPRRPKRRKVLRILAAAVLAVLALVVASTVTNVVLERQERASITPYGERVAVTGGGSVNVFRNGQPGPAIILLSGLGTPAPALDFAPLIRELGDFNVMVVEGFGYGYSDLSAASERSNRNISTELHEVLGKLNVAPPYTLAGHSIAGFYMLDYANRYPEEVAAVVAIDASVPKATSGPEQVKLAGPGFGRLLAVTGVVRSVLAVAPSLGEPDGDAYTPEERERMRLMTSWNFGNQAVADETARIANNASDLRGVSYPDGLPVLAFVADDGSPEAAGKTPALENLLKNVKRHQIVALPGHHYLHWTQSKPMAEAIRTFLATG